MEQEEVQETNLIESDLRRLHRAYRELSAELSERMRIAAFHRNISSFESFVMPLLSVLFVTLGNAARVPDRVESRMARRVQATARRLHVNPGHLPYTERYHLVVLSAYFIARQYVETGRDDNPYHFIARRLPVGYVRELVRELSIRTGGMPLIDAEACTDILPESGIGYFHSVGGIIQDFVEEHFAYTSRPTFYRIRKEAEHRGRTEPRCRTEEDSSNPDPSS